MHSKLRHFYTTKNGSPIKRLTLVIFFSGIAYALVSSVWAVHLRSFFSSDFSVGFTSSLFIAISFISYFLIIPLIEASNKYKLTLRVSFYVALGFIMYAVTKNFYLFLLFASINAIFGTIRGTTLGLLIKSNSSKEKLSKDEGFVFAFHNIAFLIGPLIATLLLLKFPARSIFLLSAFIIFVSILMLRSSKVNQGEPKKKIDKNFYLNFIGFFKKKERVKAYLLASGVNFWWSLAYIYMPLLIIKSLPNYWVGIFLSAITLPLILFEYSFGKTASKKGYKKLFFLGFILPALACVICFIFFTNLYLIMALLFISSFGLAMTEANSEAYFFAVSNKEEEQRYYSPFKTSVDTGHIIGQFTPALILLVLPMKFVFLFFAAGMFALSLLSLFIKKFKK
ncbi:MAG TPA: MFS transporter [Candidatus Nanoarchaeia archaeon]|nr:MFS transporter [Candidatus Nanoarchaeia archaeon]